MPMAVTTIKSTYALDLETVKALENMARRWNVSKSEALRRAIREAAARTRSERNEAIDALDELQASLELTPAKVRKWAERVHTERRVSASRRETRAE